MGNHPSRLKHLTTISNSGIEVWGCNSMFLEKPVFPTMTMIGLIDTINIKSIKAFYKHYLKHQWAHFKVYNDLQFMIPKELKDWAKPIERYQFFTSDLVLDTGHRMIAQALDEGYDKIFLYGFGRNTEHIYLRRQMSPYEKQTVEKQLEKNWVTIKELYPDCENKIEFIS